MSSSAACVVSLDREATYVMEAAAKRRRREALRHAAALASAAAAAYGSSVWRQQGVAYLVLSCVYAADDDVGAAAALQCFLYQNHQDPFYVVNWHFSTLLDTC